MDFKSPATRVNPPTSVGGCSVAELRAANLSELSKVLERIRLVKGISSTETSIHLETYRTA